MNERTWEEENVIETYKWANGFTRKRMNKVQYKLGDGCNYGMAYIILGFGLVIHFPFGIWLSFTLNNSDYGMVISFILYFVIGLALELYCSIQRDKRTYNNMIERETQLNLFKDFGVEIR